MKKWISLLLVMVMLVFCCSCASKSSFQGTQEELRDIMGEIARIPVATMGVSVTITARAVDLLDWCEATSMSKEELCDFANSVHRLIETPELFEEQLQLVLMCARTLSNEELRADTLEGAGFSRRLKWNDKAFEYTEYVLAEF